MKGKYINESWYIVFDGTSYYGVLGMDLEDALASDEDLILVSRTTYRDYPEERIEQLNEEAYGEEFSVL